MDQTTNAEVRLQKASGTKVQLSWATAATASPDTGGAGAVDVHKRALEKELYERFGELLDQDWHRRDAASNARVTRALDDMLKLGRRIAAHCDGRRPPALNISGAKTGEILFTLFGVNAREAELWVGANPGIIEYVLAEPHHEERDGEWPIDNYDAIANWLNGSDTLPA